MNPIKPAYTIDLDIQPVAELVQADMIAEQLQTAVSLTLQQENIEPPALLTLVLTDDATVADLNEQFRGEAKPTDVLSFAPGEPLPGMAGLDGMPLYLGDIIISVPYAARQSRHGLAAELQLLVVHGVLHLLGHDHGDPAEKALMWAAQQTVLDQLELGHLQPLD